MRKMESEPASFDQQPMTSEEPFLTAIRQKPDDRSRWLVYADWLEQRGDPRGELIRVGQQLERLPAGDRRWLLARARESQLRRQAEPKVFAPLHGFGVRDVEYQYNLPIGVELSAARFVKYADDLFTAAPLLQRVRLLDAEPMLSRLVNIPQLARLRSLSLATIGQQQVCDDGVELLAASVYLCGLRVLNLRGNDLKARGSRALARSASFEQLSSLDLSYNNLGDSGLAQLAAGNGLTALRHLNLAYNQAGPRGMAALAAAPALRQLEWLDLSNNSLGPVGTARLTESRCRASLRWLDLSSNSLGSAGLSALAANRFPSLTTLNISGNNLTDTGLADPTLTATGLPNSRPSALGLAALDDLSWCPRLQSLDLSYNRLGLAGAEELAARSYVPPLAHLNMQGNALGYEGVRRVASRLTETTLEVAYNRLTDEQCLRLTEEFGERLVL